MAEQKSRKEISEINEGSSYDKGMVLISGDNNVYATGGASVFVNSELKDSLNKTHKENEELGKALIALMAHVADSGDFEAEEAYKNLEESIKSNDKPSKIKAFWNEFTRVLPSAAKFTAAAAAIAKLFG